MEEGDTNVLLVVELTLANPLQEHTKSPHPLMGSVPPIMGKTPAKVQLQDLGELQGLEVGM